MNSRLSFAKVRDGGANPSRDLRFARAAAEERDRNRLHAKASRVAIRAREKCPVKSRKSDLCRTCLGSFDAVSTLSLSGHLERSDRATAFVATVQVSRSLPEVRSSTLVWWVCEHDRSFRRWARFGGKKGSDSRRQRDSYLRASATSYFASRPVELSASFRLSSSSL